MARPVAGLENTILTFCAAIGIAVSGTTNMPSRGTVTVVESSQLQDSAAKNDANSTSFIEELDNDLTWESWLDDDLLNNSNF